MGLVWRECCLDLSHSLSPFSLLLTSTVLSSIEQVQADPLSAHRRTPHRFPRLDARRALQLHRIPPPSICYPLSLWSLRQTVPVGVSNSLSEERGPVGNEGGCLIRERKSEQSTRRPLSCSS